MKASELKAGTLYASTKCAQPGILLSDEAIYGTVRGIIGGGQRVSAGKNYPVLTTRMWGERLTIEQLQEAAKGFKPAQPGEYIDENTIPEGVELEFWPSRKFDGEYETVMARNAATQENAQKAWIAREEKLKQERENREATSARLATLLPGAAQLYESGSNLRVSIALEDLKSLLNLAEGKK